VSQHLGLSRPLGQTLPAWIERECGLAVVRARRPAREKRIDALILMVCECLKFIWLGNNSREREVKME